MQKVKWKQINWEQADTHALIDCRFRIVKAVQEQMAFSQKITIPSYTFILWKALAVKRVISNKGKEYARY